MKKNKYGQNAAIIGEVTEKHAAKVTLKTALGTSYRGYAGRRTAAEDLLAMHELEITRSLVNMALDEAKSQRQEAEISNRGAGEMSGQWTTRWPFISN